MRTEHFMYCCVKKYVGTQGEVCRQLKIFLTSPSGMLLAVIKRWSRFCSYSVWLVVQHYGVLFIDGCHNTSPVALLPIMWPLLRRNDGRSTDGRSKSL